VPDLTDFLDQCSEPPPAPDAALRVIALISSGQPTVGELERIIRVDEGLSFKVLKLANSSAYGASGKSFDLSRSISRLGVRTLSRLILEESAGRLYANAGVAYGLRRRDLWRGSVGGAIAAELLAERHGGDAGLCYTCALLRDIGKLVVDARYPEGAPGMLASASGSGCQPERERAVFGVDHAELGWRLAERWGLPEPIPTAIRFHHEPPPPDDARHDLLHDLVHAADAVCIWAGLAIGFDGPGRRVAPHVAEGLALDEHGPEVAETRLRLEEIESMLTGDAAA
jgi:HD-like signal output (HDOD) protein